MHPGPMNEGVEIAPDVAAGVQSVITDQVANGVAVRMAVLYLLAGARGAGGGRPRSPLGRRSEPAWPTSRSAAPGSSIQGLGAKARARSSSRTAFSRR